MAASPAPLRRRLVVGSAYSFVGLVLGQIFALILSVIYARLLGKDDLGVWAIYAQLASLAVAFASLGLEVPVARFVARLRAEGPDRLERFVSTVLSASLVAAVAVTAVLWVGADFLGLTVYDQPELSVMIRLMATFLALNSLSTLGTSILQGIQAIRKLAILGVFMEALAIPVMFITLTWFGLVGAVVGGVVLVAVGVLAVFGSAWRALRAENIRVRLGFDAVSGRELFAYTLPLLASAAILRIAYLFQQSWIALELSYGDTGLFRVAATLARIVAFVPSALTVPLLPAMSELYAVTPAEKTKEKVTTMVRMASYVGVPIALGIGLGAGPLILLLYGAEFVDAQLLTFVLVAAGFVDMVSVVSVVALLSEGRTRTILGLDVVQMLTLTVGTVVLVDAYALLGAGYATLLKSLLYGGLILIVLDRTGRLELRASARALAIAAGGFAVAALAVAFADAQRNVWLAALLIAGYVAAAWALMGSRDRALVVRMVRDVIPPLRR